MYRSLRSCPYLRLSQDVILEQSTLVYVYFTDHLLNLAQKDLPLALTKRILKDTLRGLVALHDQNIVHTGRQDRFYACSLFTTIPTTIDIKANNIFVDRKDDSQEMVARQVQLGDLEDAAHVPLGSHIIGTQVGNYMWRSPEAHAEAGLGKPSDMFSFGVVVSRETCYKSLRVKNQLFSFTKSLV
jgi:serine/threonine protein kinase